MASNLDLKIRIGAELTEIKNALRQVQGDLDEIGRKGRKGGNDASGGMSKLEASISGAKRAVGGLLAAYAALTGGSKIIQMADEMKLLDARLKLAARSNEEYARSQEVLFGLAQRTRTSLAQTIELYAKLANATREAGVSQDQLVRVTETINKAIQLSGASAASSEAALIQLGQGIASGTLRGEELNSVLEQTPRLAQAIAQGMGITVGELRKFGQDGKLSAEAVLQALQKEAGKIDEEFKQLPVTVGQAMTQLSNSVMVAAGQIDAATGTTGTLASALQSLADFIDSGTLQAGFIEEFAMIQSTFEDTVGIIEAMPGVIGDALGITKEDAGNVFGFIGDSILKLPVNLKATVQLMVVDFAAFFDKIIAYAKAFVDRAKAVVTGDTIDAVNARLDKELAQIDQARADSFENILKERQAHIDAGTAAAKRFREEREERKRLASAPGPAAGPDTRKKPAQANADALVLEKDRIQRELAMLEEGFKDSEKSIADYYARRKALQTEAIDNEIAAQKRALSEIDKNDKNAPQQQRKALAEIEILERKKADITRTTTREQAKAERDLADQVAGLNAKQLENIGKAAEARKIELEIQYRDTIKRLEAEGNTAGVQLIKNLINTEVAKTRLGEIEKAIGETTDKLQNVEQSAANRVQTGDISGGQGNAEIRAARQQTIEQLQAMRGELAALAAQNVPEAQKALDALDQKLGELNGQNLSGFGKALGRMSADLADLEENMAGKALDNFTNGFGDAIASIVTGSQTAGEAMRNLARSFIASLAQMAAEALAKKMILAAFGVPTFHTGGIVGGGRGTGTSVSPFVFAAAPRYHSGGIAGLKPGEVPAVLQAGEEVLTRNDPRHSLNGGGQASGGSNGVRIINTIDPGLIHDFMSSPQGEKVIVNAIQRNRGAVKQSLY